MGVCEFLKIPHVLQMDKAYPRDFLIHGRLKILLRTEDGKFTHPELHTKKAVMTRMGELIPKLKSRTERPQQQAAATSSGASSAAAGMSRDARKEAKALEKKAQKK